MTYWGRRERRRSLNYCDEWNGESWYAMSHGPGHQFSADAVEVDAVVGSGATMDANGMD